MQQTLTPGGRLDLLTSDELSSAMGHHFDDFIRELYRGVDFIEEQGNNNAAGALTISGFGQSGYAWSVRLISCQISAAATVSVYPAENTNVAPIGIQASIANAGNAQNEVVFLYSSEAAVYKDQRSFTLLPSAGVITSWRIKAKQVPIEMQAKL